MFSVVRADDLTRRTSVAQHPGIPTNLIRHVLLRCIQCISTPLSCDVSLQPSLSGLLFTTLARVNADIAKERKGWAAETKVLREDFAEAFRAKVEETHSVREVAKAVKAELEQQREAFRAFQATAQARLDGELQGLCVVG